MYVSSVLSVPEPPIEASLFFHVPVSMFFKNLGAGHAEIGRSDVLWNIENSVASWRAMAVPRSEDLQVATAQLWK